MKKLTFMQALDKLKHNNGKVRDVRLFHANKEYISHLEKKNEILMEAINSISKNSCCDKCQEVRLVALSALEKIEEIG